MEGEKTNSRKRKTQHTHLTCSFDFMAASILLRHDCTSGCLLGSPRSPAIVDSTCGRLYNFESLALHTPRDLYYFMTVLMIVFSSTYAYPSYNQPDLITPSPSHLSWHSQHLHLQPITHFRRTGLINPLLVIHRLRNEFWGPRGRQEGARIHRHDNTTLQTTMLLHNKIKRTAILQSGGPRLTSPSVLSSPCPRT